MNAAKPQVTITTKLTPMTSRTQQIQAALDHLRRADPRLGRIIHQVGPFRLRLERDRFQMLVRSIISQQISTQAARSIRLRLEQLLAPDGITPQTLSRAADESLRSIGLSPQKLAYIRDLCEHVIYGRVRLARIGRLSDEEIIQQLVQIKGIGRWTAQMFLIFSLGRLDVFPHDDLGVRAAIRDLHDLSDLPDKATCLRLAEPWRPYASVASWYCWRMGDLRRQQPTGGPFPV